MFKNSPNDVLRVREALKLASLNNMMCSVFGKIYDLDSFNLETEELMKLIDEGYELFGMLNWSDHFSWSAKFNPQRIKYRCSELVPKVNRFRKISRSDMIAVLWEMIFRGTDAVAVLVEWILARMVLHPDAQSKVQVEKDSVVRRSRAVTESDISEMIYLSAVVKEVLRLHPPGALLSWSRLAITDTTVDGYHVPAGTTAMVNMWVITRDAYVWADPLRFKPKRFMNNAHSDVYFSVLGSDTRLTPFGFGRRSFPGKTLGLTTVTFWVSTLLHEFEFEPNSNVDLSEVLKLSCEMTYPLMVKIRSRRATSN
ncbi:hypothetical protein K7X08_016556 [Anisodus acutangulus]|uniref:Cytochrome P450 n=1 Tax=Anisodus acutangulus TaxID=402998 RepID=A0A9Q1R0M2_9SOLA|nr:hypothetical protein K7X08_016556 [Anisodus acutangulus]